ncbi:hypothetical protein F7725_028506 [Dissostichus mawsoni]|uniref:CUB domain-containing protein n=1 Tax=Dissostichus mawsoni TaxID=36200 RepID=A0A7J5XIC4_DISMA|nr:hypothetical protein F7725_028506 [Dissostichus mawsoni]
MHTEGERVQDALQHLKMDIVRWMPRLFLGSGASDLSLGSDQLCHQDSPPVGRSREDRGTHSDLELQIKQENTLNFVLFRFGYPVFSSGFYAALESGGTAAEMSDARCCKSSHTWVVWGNKEGYSSEEQLGCEACWSMWNVGEGSRRRDLHSPNYPNKYPPTTECVYILEAPPRQCIDLHFEENYSIESSWECKFDNIEVRMDPLASLRFWDGTAASTARLISGVAADICG